ncbi:MAG: division/cell wall cluster transcriptional repressor MraZ [Halothiobacillaceae bacterium]|nr:MAG: division/cell wall cluster transcriptional repressor MraZ [Halothiobacillaceae bacterium]
MFRGISKLSLDAKGRFAVPTRYREGLAAQCEGNLILTVSADAPCLAIYPLPVWLEIERQLDALPGTHRKATRIKRLLIGHATELTLDASGRLLVPPELRDYAGLDKGAVLVGQGKKFELWDESAWDAAMYGEEDDGDEGEGPEALEQIAL